MNPAALQDLLRHGSDAQAAIEKELCERSLYKYLERAWPQMDPARFIGGWNIEAIAEHLEAIAQGEIRRLLINIAPRACKTFSCSVAFPTWLWTLKPDPQYPLMGPSAQILCVSYGDTKAQEDGVTARRLIGSPWYQRHWGDHVKIASDRDNAERYDTTAGGSRINVGINAAVIGRGGNVKIIDDAHKPNEVESDIERRKVLKAYDETLSSRENDPNIAAEIIIAQRLHENDLCGHVLTKYGSDPDNGGFCHLMISAEYDSQRHCVTVLGWQDPRGAVDRDPYGETLPDEQRAERDGESFWPERFPAKVLKQRKQAEGEYSWSSKYQQSPVPRGGGIIKPEWWMEWPPQGEEFDDKGKPTKPLAFPPMDYIVAALDTAYTERQENDPSAMTVWGSFSGDVGHAARTKIDVNDPGGRDDFEERAEFFAPQPRIMLMAAWEARLEIHALVNKTIMTCRKHKVDVLIIETQAAGLSVAQELRRLFAGEKFTIKIVPARGSKDARLHSVAHMFEASLVYRPIRQWAQAVVDQMSAGSKGAHDDLADTGSTALRHLRQIGEAPTKIEHDRDVRNEYGRYGEEEALYDV